jgi:transposase
MVHEHEGEYGSQWEAIRAIAPKIGCCVDSLRRWLREAEEPVGLGLREVQVPVDEALRIKALEQEVRELRQANEILRKASAYFAQAELDRRFKP